MNSYRVVKYHEFVQQIQIWIHISYRERALLQQWPNWSYAKDYWTTNIHKGSRSKSTVNLCGRLWTKACWTGWSDMQGNITRKGDLANYKHLWRYSFSIFDTKFWRFCFVKTSIKFWMVFFSLLCLFRRTRLWKSKNWNVPNAQHMFYEIKPLF